ncbi:MAG: hypothetical protein GWP06_19250, partial [Actinobacteria bacterium]|nr:hypothetical protein [Actinomycetota bacterium]
GRTREFKTPLGVFTYRNITLSQFSLGMEIIEPQPDVRFMMASPEKALADFIQSQKGVPSNAAKQYEQYLFEDIRLDEKMLSRLTLRELEAFSAVYKSQKLSRLCNIIKRMQHKGA